MFEQLNNSRVQLMLALSKENITDTERLKQQLMQVELPDFFQLCKEHELDGVVASHVLTHELMTLPDYWQEAYEKVI